MNREALTKALIVTAEVLGHELSTAGAELMVHELAGYDSKALEAALRRCTRELRGRLRLADILERIPGRHLGPEEAWALCPRSEAETVVWTDEIAQAFRVARPLIEDGDMVAARMAFREAYARICAESTSTPSWLVSLGHDVVGRSAPILEAESLGRLPQGYAAAQGSLPPPTPTQELESGQPSSISEVLSKWND